MRLVKTSVRSFRSFSATFRGSGLRAYYGGEAMSWSLWVGTAKLDPRIPGGLIVVLYL